MKGAMISAGVLVALAGSAMAQPVIDGFLDPSYGTIVWSNNQPTAFGNNGPVALGGPPENVTTGVEIRIPLSELGAPSFPIWLGGMINSGGHNFVSNQVIGGLGGNTPNLGEVRNVDFSAIAGNQYAVLNPATGTPVIDGTRDAAYGAPIFVQNNFTGFGNANLGDPFFANGNEIDAVYALRDGSNLYLFIAGNLASDFTKLDLFFDTDGAASGIGQNQLRGDNIDIDFNGLNRMGDDGSGNGLKFDANFDADYIMILTGGNNPYEQFANFASILTGGGPGTGGYIGTSGPNTAVWTATNGIQFGFNNSNTAGVSGISIPHPDFANGSELNNFYALNDGERLNLFFGGNLESNFTKLCLLIDSINEEEDPNSPGNFRKAGQNELRSDNVDVSFNKLNRLGIGGNGALPANPSGGLKLDAGIYADYWMFVNVGGGAPDTFADSAVLRTDGINRDINGQPTDYGAFHGGARSASVPPVNYPATFRDTPGGGNIYTNMGPRLAALQGPLTPGLISATVRNDNIGGVSGTSGPIDISDAPNVTSGAEISIDLDELGWNGVDGIKIVAFIINDPGDFISNQVLGGLPYPTVGDFADNLGEPTFVDFSSIPGRQWHTVCRGDINADGVVDLGDFFEFFGGFDTGDIEISDVNRDYSVDLGDFFDFFSNYDVGC